MFVYCLNNPEKFYDPLGTFSFANNDDSLDESDEQYIAGGSSTSLQTYYPPNNGFSGTAHEQLLPKGTVLQRTGSLNGRFVAPAGTPLETLSLPYGQLGETTTYIVVQEPALVLAGTAAPWFGQMGGGTQYLLLDGTVASLLDAQIFIVGGR